MLFANFPYDYNVLWATPTSSPPGAVGDASTLDLSALYFNLQESHLKFLHASPPLISRILHIVIGTGLLGFVLKLYKPSEANMLFDGASLALYMCGITVYVANIVKGLRTVTADAYGGVPSGSQSPPAGQEHAATEAPLDYIGREDSLRVLAASNTILALILVGVLVLQAGQWYAQRKEAQELEAMDKTRDEKKKAAKEGGSKKKQ